MKTCTRCKRRLPSGAFHAHKQAADGLMTICRDCNTAQCRESRRRRALAKMSGDELAEKAQDLCRQLAEIGSELNRRNR